MPELVELRVSGGERRGMPVAEADDSDARREVEVLLARVVGEPDTVTVDEGDPPGAYRRDSRAGHDHTRQVEWVGGVDGDALTVTR